jgi:hypothetical protein
MKTTYRFIKFTEHKRPEGVQWDCVNNKSGHVLGTCSYYAPWRQWVFSQHGPDIVFSADCLTDIAHFMGQLGVASRRTAEEAASHILNTAKARPGLLIP